MAGNTGKMTRAALEDRGPRAQLVTVLKVIGATAQPIGLLIFKSGHMPFRSTVISRFGIVSHGKSYSLSYLLAISRAMRIKP